MLLFITGGTGVLGRAFVPLAREADHAVIAPTHDDVDLYDAAAVADAVRGVDAVIHLATRIPSLDALDEPEAWRENDRLRTEASANLVEAARAAAASVFVQPTVTFVYPSDRVADEETPIRGVWPTLVSSLIAELNALSFTRDDRRGVVLRLGLLDGPGTGHDEPLRAFGATLHVEDAARALLMALTLGPGIYNACRDGEPVSNARLAAASGWRPRH